MGLQASQNFQRVIATPGKIKNPFTDWHQHNHGHTAASPYTAHTKTYSAPNSLYWEYWEYLGSTALGGLRKLICKSLGLPIVLQ